MGCGQKDAADREADIQCIIEKLEKNKIALRLVNHYSDLADIVENERLTFKERQEVAFIMERVASVISNIIDVKGGRLDYFVPDAVESYIKTHMKEKYFHVD